MLTSDFDYHLPQALIAQRPCPERTASRLLTLDRATGERQHRRFAELPKLLRSGDLLILNESKVFPARLRGRKVGTEGEVEFLLTERAASGDWWALARPGKRLRPGTQIQMVGDGNPTVPLTATIASKKADGLVQIHFEGADVIEFAHQFGEIPLPPYIERPPHSRDPEDLARYQTVFAQEEGSIAAPTAGLHFSTDLLRELQILGVETRHVCLHVGLGTFAPVKSERVEDHPMHTEKYRLPVETAEAIGRAKREGRRVVAVGTTSLRVLESAARRNGGTIMAAAGETDLFLYPPANFQVVDALITNFHLPQSTLLMLVSAFAAPGKTSGRETMLSVYAEAVLEQYRFFSYGDAMFIA